MVGPRGGATDLSGEHVLDVLEGIRREYVRHPQVRLASRLDRVDGVARDEHGNAGAHRLRRTIDCDDARAVQDQVRLVLFVPMGV